MKRDEKEFF
jgi:dynein heavy chain, axonemal